MFYSGPQFKVPRCLRHSNGRLSGYSDSRNWASGLQPVATESDTAKQPRGQRGAECARLKKIDKRVQARVDAGLVRMGQRREDKNN